MVCQWLEVYMGCSWDINEKLRKVVCEKSHDRSYESLLFRIIPFFPHFFLSLPSYMNFVYLISLIPLSSNSPPPSYPLSLFTLKTRLYFRHLLCGQFFASSSLPPSLSTIFLACLHALLYTNIYLSLISTTLSLLLLHSFFHIILRRIIMSCISWLLAECAVQVFWYSPPLSLTLFSSLSLNHGLVSWMQGTRVSLAFVREYCVIFIIVNV